MAVRNTSCYDLNKSLKLLLLLCPLGCAIDSCCHLATLLQVVHVEEMREEDGECDVEEDDQRQIPVALLAPSNECVKNGFLQNAEPNFVYQLQLQHKRSQSNTAEHLEGLHGRD